MRTSRLTLSTRHGGALLVTVALAESCMGSAPLPVGCTLFLPDDSGCHRHERELITAAWREVGERVCATPPEFVRCLSRGACSPVERADVETITGALRRPGWTTVRCADLTLGRDAETAETDDGPVVRVDHGYLAGGKTRRPLVETLAHELSHALGYSHYGKAGDALGEYSWSVPVRFEACVSPIPSSEAEREVALAPLGDISGETVERDSARWCPAGTIASGVTIADSAGATSALSLTCRGDASEVAVPLLAGASSQTLGCGRDALVGVRASGSERGVVIRQALCLPRSAVQAATGSGLTAVPRSTALGAVERRCPRGLVVRGFEASHTGALRRIRVWCEALDRAQRPVTWSDGARVGAMGHTAASARTWRCDGDGAVVGVFGFLSARRDGIVRLGAWCMSPPAPSPDTGLRVPGEERVLPALGAAPTDADIALRARCEEGRVAIGVRFRSTLDGALPSRVGVLCGTADGSVTPTWTDDGHTAAALGSESRCPSGSFVGGLTVETARVTTPSGATHRVSTLQPRCRALSVTR